ncbi:uncharacterized protein LACBIDRAFT_316838 [Laccaria bicolor S238N-H82]|uniref:Predicted protein n=1 Tax=Laccaria bicolor (strain S238N-H82 / ATCC MYA-4686) TaxID=486041 RepID=B0E1Q1_LACBS|nr:uncharacterized protein LACBIDRAFT_316838 [Laccaria bicolor S238N-H82]EDQ99213.1 predicted protein [Laccaria bicolor S238N-H82]|eukprot:XP_001890110.1 predicted protein [Laccaria bicolor S238N-H82]
MPSTHICPQQVEEAFAAGMTMMIGGRTGPSAETNTTTCTVRASSESEYDDTQTTSFISVPIDGSCTYTNQRGTHSEEQGRAKVAGREDGVDNGWGSTHVCCG